jgi:hypothetical protein
VNHRIWYTDPANDVTYTLAYNDQDPANVRITGPRQGAGVLVPFRALDYLMAAYRLSVHHDHFEHQPAD